MTVLAVHSHMKRRKIGPAGSAELQPSPTSTNQCFPAQFTHSINVFSEAHPGYEQVALIHIKNENKNYEGTERGQAYLHDATRGHHDLACGAAKLSKDSCGQHKRCERAAQRAWSARCACRTSPGSVGSNLLTPLPLSTGYSSPMHGERRLKFCMRRSPPC